VPASIGTFVGWLEARIGEVQREPPLAERHAAEIRGQARALEVEDLDEAALAAKLEGLRQELGAVPGREAATVRDPALEPALRRRLAPAS
jgi:hypothetical protein